MRNFKQFQENKIYNKSLTQYSVALKSKQHELFLQFDSKEKLTMITYTGPMDPWMESMCFLSENKTLSELRDFSIKIWDKAFGHDLFYLDLKTEITHEVFYPHLELLHAALNLYIGQDYLYQEQSPLICRCFGVREDDVREYLRTEKEPTLKDLSIKTKAAMGCRSCLKDLRGWFSDTQNNNRPRFYKEKPIADWLLKIDQALLLFPYSERWEMEIKSFKNGLVIITTNTNVNQKEFERVSDQLQGFLASEVDSDLSFFLSRS